MNRERVICEISQDETVNTRLHDTIREFYLLNESIISTKGKKNASEKVK